METSSETVVIIKVRGDEGPILVVTVPWGEVHRCRCSGSRIHKVSIRLLVTWGQNREELWRGPAEVFEVAFYRSSSSLSSSPIISLKKTLTPTLPPMVNTRWHTYNTCTWTHIDIHAHLSCSVCTWVGKKYFSTELTDCQDKNSAIPHPFFTFFFVSACHL